MKPATLGPPETWAHLWDGFSGTVGWDIGAHHGHTIPYMLDRFDHVYAFEPTPDCWPALDKLDGNLTWLPIALSDNADTRPFTLTVDALVDQHAIWIPDFMKIDVDGYELRVLFGARRTLAVHRPDLLIEFHTAQLHSSCQTLLEHFGYRCDTIRHPRYRPGTPTWRQHGWLRARCDS